jgi:hypothetical protein
VKIVIVEPFPAVFNGFGLHLVTEIPNKIYRSSLRKKPHGVLILYPESVGDLHGQPYTSFGNRRKAPSALYPAPKGGGVTTHFDKKPIALRQQSRDLPIVQSICPYGRRRWQRDESQLWLLLRGASELAAQLSDAGVGQNQRQNRKTLDK